MLAVTLLKPVPQKEDIRIEICSACHPLSTQESKSLLIQAAELISSENVMVLKSKKLDTADCGVFFI